jgi:hypothetical protein
MGKAAPETVTNQEKEGPSAGKDLFDVAKRWYCRFGWVSMATRETEDGDESGVDWLTECSSLFWSSMALFPNPHIKK